MFDDNNTNNNPPNNLPTEPLDIFSGVEESDLSTAMNKNESSGKEIDALSAGVLTPKQPVVENSHLSEISFETELNSDQNLDKRAQSLNQITQYKIKEPVLGKILFIVLLVVAVIVLLTAGWYIYGKFVSSDSADKTGAQVAAPTVSSSQGNNAIPAVDNSVTIASNSEAVNGQTTDTILFGEPIDTDADGLDDIREKQLGTDANNKDSDGDQLTDGDEVLIWKTLPLNKDTDNDTYPDGHEIKNGYSPLGPGKLYFIPTSTTSSTK